MSLPFSALDCRSVPRARSAGVRAGWGGALGLACLSVAGCGDEAPLQPRPEAYRVVVGMPSDEAAPPLVDVVEGRPGSYRPARPRQCDTFRQEARRKVDILWVVDSSNSMADVQQKLATYFAGFVAELAEAAVPVDFHLGVITTDVDRAEEALGIGPGWLRRPAGATEPFVACAPVGGVVRCNVGDGSAAAAVDAFRLLVQVGVDGSPEEKGLLAATLALSEPLRSTRNAGFLRPDAALSVIFVSDEEDSSCGPYVDDEPCLAGPSCKCEDSPTWGSVAYFGRFFRGLKGFGNDASVRIGAIVATERDVLDFPDDTGRDYIGCTSDSAVPCRVDGAAGAAGAECAFHAPRYVALAEASGGAAVSICADDYSAGLSELGLGSSGLRSDFPLGRMPIQHTIDVVVVPNDAVSCNDAAPCSAAFPDCIRGLCSRNVARGLPEGWEHVICSGGTQRNVVRFSGRSIPDPLHTVEVCYDVDVGTDVSMCQ